MPSNKNDITHVSRGGQNLRSSVADESRAGLLDAMGKAGLLPFGTVTQASPPTDTSILWVDTASNPEQIKYYDGAGWVQASHEQVFKKHATYKYGVRVYLYSDNRWVSNSSVYGNNLQNFNTNKGTGVEPTFSWADKLFVLKKGEYINKVSFLGRMNNAQLQGLNVRLYYHTGAWGTWNSNAETQRTLLLSEDNILTTLTNNNDRESFTIDFIAPDDGYFIAYIQPVGTLTANRFWYMDMVI